MKHHYPDSLNWDNDRGLRLESFKIIFLEGDLRGGNNNV